MNDLVDGWFWRMHRGEQPPPPVALLLKQRIVRVDPADESSLVIHVAAPIRRASAFWTPGYLGPEALSYHLQAADIAIQPYPDGADTRRTSLMACLANGVPTVTTRGRFTTGDVMLSVVGYPVAGEPHTAGQIAAEIQADPRTAVVGEFPDLPLREATRAAYLANFAIDHPVARLLADEDGG